MWPWRSCRFRIARGFSQFAISVLKRASRKLPLLRRMRHAPPVRADSGVMLLAVAPVPRMPERPMPMPTVGCMIAPGGSGCMVAEPAISKHRPWRTPAGYLGLEHQPARRGLLCAGAGMATFAPVEGLWARG